ncbi:MAG TPA: ATP-binding protein [Polyangia bacterium]|nr:ATP-binding protein [Polyangia bacterium]
MSSAKTDWLRSIGVRLTLWYVLVFLVSTGLLAGLAVFRIHASLHRQIVETVTADLNAHKAAFEMRGLDGVRELSESAANAPKSLYVRVSDGADVTLFEHRSVAALDFDAAAIAPNRASSKVHAVHAPSDGSTWSTASTPLGEGRWLQLAISDDQTREIVGHLRAGLVAVWLGAVVIGLVGGFILMRRALRPVQQFAATADAVMTSGDLSLRLPERGTRDELDELARLFNGVLARNQALVRGMREALDNVAHDLRTPLTRLRTGAEVALAGPAAEATLRDALADTIEESERVLAMLKTLMDISEAETGVMKLDRTAVDLSALIRETIDLYQHVADERSVRLVTHLDSALTVAADANRLRQVIANLLDNAIKYSTTGGQVELTAARADGAAVLSVADRGAGIAADDLPRIWQRLYRADQSRSERGLGLGLSFVKAIVEAHGGRVEVRSELGAGSTFVVRLPLA